VTEGDLRGGHSAFVLSGGGSRGAFQVGMLAELVDRGVHAERVYGASVGAVNGSAYCSDPTPGGMRRLEAIWRGIHGSDVFPSRRTDGPWSLFRRRSGLHSNAGLRAIVAAGLRFERLEDAPIPFEVVASSLADGSERWLTEGPALEAILASAAVPVLFPPVIVDGEPLIDGGVVDNVPITRAIGQGATTIYVLLCGPLHFRPRVPRRPVESLLTSLYVAIHARFERERAALPPGVELVVFCGDHLPERDYRHFGQTERLIDAGRAEVASVLSARGSSGLGAR
jgi:NTE family protein